MLAKGTILKNWVVGDKLGSGACSDVYAVTSKSNSSESFAMKLSPIPPPSKSKKKTHAARSADALYAEHLLYVNTLQGIPGIPALPTTGAYGEDKGYRFLVIQRLGRTLEQVKTANGGTLPESTVARLGLEIVYCVDFGIAERYILVTGAHKPYKTGAVVGTPTFSSVHCHGGASTTSPPPRLFVVVMMTPLAPSRRDDLEALLYVCLYLIRGDLPWQSATSDAEGARVKAECDPNHLCASLAGEWKRLLSTIRLCGFDQEPNYDDFETSLKRIAGPTSLRGVYQWGTSSTASKRAKLAASTIAPALAKGRMAAAVDLSAAKTSASSSPTDDGKENKATSVKKGGVKRKDPPSSTKTPPQPDVVDVDLEKKRKEPSERRKKAASRAVGALAAASAAVTRARRTRSTTQAELQ
ncbi:hypothetical protein DYB26_012174 [Aphanomyces astaci]|uniref:Casein kinase I n=2 Tax=Aphanomyces astaci TaxID=112090 RepID=A0A418FSK6_APHAT|nr:hypothetical protein DYB26_012174 [Aphanomyces astaci]